LQAIVDQTNNQEGWIIAENFLTEVQKGITLVRVVPHGEPLYDRILDAASELKAILRAAEVALAGFQWKDVFSVNEDSFCKELVHPLLRRMGFSFVRYSHGKREYGKDFTFSEVTPFGHYRHYGLQAKAGDVSGGVNSAIDELLGQIDDAFSMPFYEVGSK